MAGYLLSGPRIVSGAKDDKPLKNRSNHITPLGEVIKIKEPVSFIIIQFHDQLTNTFSKITKLNVLMKRK